MYAETENNCSLLIFCDYLPAEWLSYLRFTEKCYFYYELIQTQRFIELSRPNGDNLLYKPKPQKGKIVMQNLGCLSSSVSLPKILLEFNHQGRLFVFSDSSYAFWFTLKKLTEALIRSKE